MKAPEQRERHDGAASANPGAPAPPPIRHDPSPGLLLATLHALYDCLWVVSIIVASPWWFGRSLFDREFRAGVKRRLTFGLPDEPSPGHKPRILIHGVSVGEIKGSQSLVQALRESYPEHQVVISTTTNTGAEVAGKLFPELLVAGFPVDVSFLIRRFLTRVRPSFVVLMELEIWPNFLRCANRAGIPMAVVNGRITQSSFGRYIRFRHSLPQFNRVSLFCAQSTRYGERFARLAGGMTERVVITGNLKVDGLGDQEISRPTPELTRWVAAREGQVVVVAGSTHEPEERLVTRACRDGAPDARVVLVPRHPGRARDVLRALAAEGASAQLLTELRAGTAEPDPRRPLVVDTIGELEQFYGLANVVFVGGSLIAHGGQNMLEPAAQGIPVLYGPSVNNFREEAALLEESGAALRVADAAELARKLGHLCQDPSERERMARAGVEAVQRQRGATELTLQALSRFCLGPRSEGSSAR